MDLLGCCGSDQLTRYRYIKIGWFWREERNVGERVLRAPNRALVIFAWAVGIETQNFHLAVIVGIVVRGKFLRPGRQRDSTQTP